MGGYVLFPRGYFSYTIGYLSFVNPSQVNSHKLGTGLTIWSYISVINE